jgi:hypothetical protein
MSLILQGSVGDAGSHRLYRLLSHDSVGGFRRILLRNGVKCSFLDSFSPPATGSGEWVTGYGAGCREATEGGCSAAKRELGGAETDRCRG